MYNRILLLLLVLAVTLPFMGCKKDDNHPTQYITGRVIFVNNGKPIKGSKVRLEHYSEEGCGFFSDPKTYCQIGYEITTDTTGEFKFSYDRDKNPDGDYRVNLRLYGDYDGPTGNPSVSCKVTGNFRSNTGGEYVYLDKTETHTDITFNVKVKY